MQDKKRFVPSPSMAVALAALFVALGGTAVAAVVAANSVNSASIIDGAVKRVDIAGSAVNSAKVANGSLSASDLSSSAKKSIRATRWALVAGDGTVVKSSHPVTTTHPFTGEYRVDFGVPTSGHLVMASISERDNSGQPMAIQSAPCGVTPGPTSDGYTNCQGAANVNKAAVVIRNATTGAVTNYSFYIALMP